MPDAETAQFPSGEEEELTDSSDPVSFHLKFNQPSGDAISVDQSAVKLLDATERLQVRTCLFSAVARGMFKKLFYFTSGSLPAQCLGVLS